MPRKYSTCAPSSAARAVADPGEVRAQVVPAAAPRHLPGLGLLVVEVQSFVAGEELAAADDSASEWPATVSRKRTAWTTASIIARYWLDSAES